MYYQDSSYLLYFVRLWPDTDNGSMSYNVINIIRNKNSCDVDYLLLGDVRHTVVRYNQHIDVILQIIIDDVMEELGQLVVQPSRYTCMGKTKT